jgi:DNA-binding transcriptional ArsR family regulator
MKKKEESFLLVSLKENKAKKLANVINNETCRKILDFLANNTGATESEIAKKTKLPISTVHYNLKLLEESKLVFADEYHYSEKGKEVNHYKLANKYIIIAPDESTTALEKIRKFLPLTIIALIATAFIQLIPKLFASRASLATAPSFKAAADEAVMEAAPAMAGATNVTIEQVIVPATQSFFQTYSAAWFLIGAAFLLIVFLIWEFVIERKK